MKTFEFASLRGKNFRIQGETVEQAYANLVEREKDEGTLWRLHDIHMVEHCIAHGWKEFKENHINPMPVAYREVS